MTETPAFLRRPRGAASPRPGAGWRRGGPHQSGFHTPAPRHDRRDGAPRLRTVVLRGVDRTTRTLRVIAMPAPPRPPRSPPIPDLAPRLRPEGQDPGADRGTARLHGEDEIARAAWAASRPMSGSATPPRRAGTPLAAGGAYAPPEDEDGLEAGFAEFASWFSRPPGSSSCTSPARVTGGRCSPGRGRKPAATWLAPLEAFPSRRANGSDIWAAHGTTPAPGRLDASSREGRPLTTPPAAAREPGLEVPASGPPCPPARPGTAGPDRRAPTGWRCGRARSRTG